MHTSVSGFLAVTALTLSNVVHAQVVKVDGS
ncbi:MAG: hypothetical protein RLZZ126_1614, partial [Pseudomonadota bacterium]